MYPVSWRRFHQSPNKPTRLNMKNFISLRIITLVFVTGYMLKTTSADADVTFLGVAAGDATTNDVIVWTRAKDEANPQPTAINVQIS
jgi:phosphodiesterase/alkaline phosphatase D-like protein